MINNFGVDLSSAEKEIQNANIVFILYNEQCVVLSNFSMVPHNGELEFLMLSKKVMNMI